MSGFEYRAQRLASDIQYGNAVDAANVLREEIYNAPCETRALINQAYRWSSPSRRDDIVENGFGDVSVRDKFTGRRIHAGHIPEYCSPRFPGPGPFPIPIPIPIPIPFPRGGHHGGYHHELPQHHHHRR